MTREQAIQALRAQGIPNPSKQLVEDWLRVHQSQEWVLELPESAQETQASSPDAERQANSEPKPHQSSESNLEPLLRERGELQRSRGPRRAGRPRVVAPWFQAIATAMADGTPLQEALERAGIHGLTARQIRSLYRNSAFKALYRAAREQFLADYGRRSTQVLRKMRQYADL